jgi:integrase
MSGRTRTRANGEGSIFPYRNGYAAYAWVTSPSGVRKRKYVYGKTRDAVHEKWIDLLTAARRGPVATKMPNVESYLAYWLSEVVRPNLAPATAANYDMFARRYIVPDLGQRRIDKLTVRDVQMWLNQLRARCQCCVQGKDAKRDPPKCCAAGKCCRQIAGDRTIRDAWATLRIALGNAVREELISRNVAALIRVPKARSRKPKPWSVEEARRFLESARTDRDPYYAAYTLILVLGLRRGEVLGLGWEDVDLDKAEVFITWQVQRIAGQLLRRQTKTEASEAPLPLPQVCLTALRSWQDRQAKWAIEAGPAWQDSGLMVTTRYGLAVEPRNFHRSFKARCRRAAVRPIPVHTTRRTCASLLVALDVHPRVAMQILRHSQIAVTMNIYSEVSSAETRAALKRLGDELEGL